METAEAKVVLLGDSGPPPFCLSPLLLYSRLLALSCLMRKELEKLRWSRVLFRKNFRKTRKAQLELPFGLSDCPSPSLIFLSHV